MDAINLFIDNTKLIKLETIFLIFAIISRFQKQYLITNVFDKNTNHGVHWLYSDPNELHALKFSLKFQFKASEEVY